MLFFFFGYKNFRISTMKNCKKLFTSLYGMNRELSEGDYSDDLSTCSPSWELGWTAFRHDCLQIIFVFEFASDKQVRHDYVQNLKIREMFVVKSRFSLSPISRYQILFSEAILGTRFLYAILEIFLCIYKQSYIYIFLTQMTSYYSQCFKLGIFI